MTPKHSRQSTKRCIPKTSSFEGRSKRKPDLRTAQECAVSIVLEYRSQEFVLTISVDVLTNVRVHVYSVNIYLQLISSTYFTFTSCNILGVLKIAVAQVIHFNGIFPPNHPLLGIPLLEKRHRAADRVATAAPADAGKDPWRPGKP